MLERLQTNMERRFPGVKVVVTFAPEYSPDPAVPQGIDCDFLWVALGSPKQEKCCARHLASSKRRRSCRLVRRLTSMRERRNQCRIGCIGAVSAGCGACLRVGGVSSNEILGVSRGRHGYLSANMRGCACDDRRIWIYKYYAVEMLQKVYREVKWKSLNSSSKTIIFWS